MKHKEKNNSGFTIIETLIYTALIVIIVTIFSVFMVDLVRQGIKIVNIKEINQNSRFIFARINQELKTAKSIGAVSGDSISFVNADNQNASFYFDSVSKAIYLNTDGSPNTTTDNKISNNSVDVLDLSFELTSANIIGVNLNLQAKKGAYLDQKFQLETSTQIVPRQLSY